MSTNPVTLNPGALGDDVAGRADADGDILQIVDSRQEPLDDLFQFASLNGDGTGTDDFTGDYSGASTDIAYIQPGAGVVYNITRMIVSIQDGTGMSAAKYGNLSALSNGILIRKQDGGGTLIDLTPVGITHNAMYGSYCYDADLKTWGTGDQMLLARWTFQKAGRPIRLVGTDLERLEVVLDDDYTGLVMHRFLFQGYIES